MKSKWKKLPVVLIGIIAIAVCGCSNDLQELNQKRSSAAKENTESTDSPYRYLGNSCTDSLWCLS